MISSQDLPPPVTTTAYGVASSEDTPATSLFEAGDHHVEKPQAREDYTIVQHPNGSEGWLPAEDLPPNPPSPRVADMHTAAPAAAGVSRHGTTATRHSAFAGSSGGGGGGEGGTVSGASLGRASSRRSAHTTADGRVIMGGAFVNGAGTTGPYATAATTEDDELVARAQEANANLTPRQRSKIAKNEAKNGRRLSKIIKQEAKTEKKSLSLAIDELANLLKYQKAAVKSEANIQASHTKLTKTFKKAEADYLNAKRDYEELRAKVQAEADTLEILKANAREATAKVQDKSAEVDALRHTLAVDDMEREVKLGQLKGKSGFWDKPTRRN